MIMNQKEILKLVRYDEKNDRYISLFNSKINTVGKELVTYKNSIGYIVANIKGIPIGMHRLVYMYFNGDIPKGMVIDHINQVRDDNRIINLRVVNQEENCKNRRVSIASASGITGVTWAKSRNKWQVLIGVNGKNVYVGRYEKLEDAVKARKEAEVKYGYHTNHGKV